MALITLRFDLLYFHFLEEIKRPKDKPAEKIAKLCQAAPTEKDWEKYDSAVLSLSLVGCISSPKKDCIRPQAVIDDPDMFDCNLLSIDVRRLITFFCFSCLLFGSAIYFSTHSTAALNRVVYISNTLSLCNNIIILRSQSRRANAKIQ